VDLNFYKSKIRITPRDLFLHHPKDICSRYDLNYHAIRHNSQATANLIKENDIDLGIILGSRILKKHIIDSFNVGVLNLHPGILPDNRGLDTIKWAIIKKIKQGVTSHLIDSNIDRGRLLDVQAIDIYRDDTLLDLYMRILNKEQRMLIESLEILGNNFDINSLELLSNGENYHRSVPVEIESDLFNMFETYKKEFTKGD
tara:strand:- start:1937 stop:2536 length:600 start_codon:yes stop_codon:yes gene_type:complete